MPNSKPKPITHQIYETIFDLLDQNPNGMCWTDLNKQVEEANVRISKLWGLTPLLA